MGIARRGLLRGDLSRGFYEEGKEGSVHEEENARRGMSRRGGQGGQVSHSVSSQCLRFVPHALRFTEHFSSWELFSSGGKFPRNFSAVNFPRMGSKFPGELSSGMGIFLLKH
jgi:hypothetical protein